MKLVELGVDPAVAAAAVSQVIEEIHDERRMRWLGALIFLIAWVNADSGAKYYSVVLPVNFVLGWFLDKSCRLGGVGAGVLATFAMPFAYLSYFAGRKSYRSIEELIPLAMALVPALSFFFVMKWLYACFEKEPTPANNPHVGKV